MDFNTLNFLILLYYGWIKTFLFFNLFPNSQIHILYFLLLLLDWQSNTQNELVYAAAAAKSLQSCPTLCDPIDGSPTGFPTPGILQARTLEWVAISFSNAWKWKVKVKSLSHVWL